MPSKGKQKGRDPKTGRFVKGYGGGGRKEIPADIKEMLAAATPSACKLLAETINDQDAKLDLRIRACEIVLDRVYGKPKQAVDIDAANIPQVIFVGGDEIAD